MSSFVRFWRVVVCALVAGMFSQPLAIAQTDARIVGLVTDGSGASCPA